MRRGEDESSEFMSESEFVRKADKMKEKMATIFMSYPDLFTFLIGALMFYISAVIVNAPPLATKGGIYGAAFGMVGGLYYDKIKKRLQNSYPTETQGETAK